MVLISKEGDFEKPSSAAATPQAAAATNPEGAAGSSYPEVEANGPTPEDSFPYFNHSGWGYRGRGGRGHPFMMHGNFNRHHHHHRPETVPLDDEHIHHDPHHPHPMPPAPPMPPVGHPDPPEAPLPPPPPPQPVPPMPYGFDLSTLGPRIAGMVGEQTANWAQAFANGFSPNSHEGGHQHHPGGSPWSPRHGRGFPFGRRGGGFGWSGPGTPGRWGPPFPHHPPPPPTHFHGHWHGRHGHGHGHGSRLIHPNMDIFHSENTYVVTVELPGLQKSDVDLGVKDGVLTISGEFPSRKDGDAGDGGDEAAQDIFDYMEDDMYHVMVDDEGEEITLMEQPSDRKGEQQASTSGGARGAAEKGKYILHERPIGKFKRSVRLPPWVDVDAIKATMSDGVLTLVLEKPAPEKKDDGTRRINIL